MKHSSVRSQPVYWLKADLLNLANLKIGDPTKVARLVDNLLEGDRYQCDPKGYEVCLNESDDNFEKCARIFTEEITLVAPEASAFGPTDCHNHIRQVSRWEEDEMVG